MANPLGYIIEKPGGLEEQWVTKLPNDPMEEVPVPTMPSKEEPLDPEKSLETLQEYKDIMKAKLKNIDEQLGKL